MVHRTKLARVKTLENGQTLDPPAWSRWSIFMEGYKNDRDIANADILHAENDYNVT